MQNPVPDEELWNALQEDDSAAFTLLVRRHARLLISYGRKFSPDPEVVQDAVQDLFAEIWQYRKRITPVQNIHTYLYVSLRRKILKAVKRSSGISLSEPGFHEIPFHITFSVQEQWIESESEHLRIRYLNSLINRLPERQKEALYLKFYQNLSHEEIAEVMGIRYQSVSNLIQRALEQIRRHWKQEPDIHLLIFSLFRLVV